MSPDADAGQSCVMSPSNVPVRVFLADDSAAIRSRIRVLLEPTGARVVGEGEAPQECIDGILASKADVVVLDIQLRGGSGLQVLRAVREAAPGISFVVFSNSSTSPYRKRFLQEGAFRFLDKNTESGDLANAVAQAAGTAPPETSTTPGAHHAHSNP
jgi:two-component system response regulator DesR